MTVASIKTIDDLIANGLAKESDRQQLNRVVDRYALAIPAHLRRHLNPAGVNGPLARQFVPDVRELQIQSGERDDPIGDQAHSPVTGVVHRYQNRVLLKLVSVCPVYCRFCFRREMIGPGHARTLSEPDIAHAISYIANTPSIDEVIVTGGDPLILSPRRIRSLTHQLSKVPHLTRVRWHSRVPVACPERVTDDLVSALTDTHLKVRVAIHANHADEFGPETLQVCQRFISADIGLLSQSVLLAGVNDTTSALNALFDTFPRAGITPYYLHQLDLAPGTSHFRVPIRDGLTLLQAVRQASPGLALPTYMLDIPGGYGKVPINHRYATLIEHRRTGDLYRIRDPLGGVHIYFDRTTP